MRASRRMSECIQVARRFMHPVRIGVAVSFVMAFRLGAFPSLAAADQLTRLQIIPARKLETRGDLRHRSPLSARARVHEFAGMGPCEAGYCWAPGEPVIAVGPNHVVQTVNTAATVYDKSTGSLLSEFDFETFWGPGTMFCVDPRAI